MSLPLVGAGPSAPSALFAGAYDNIPNIVAAYGMRRMLSSYTGSLIRVRRSSDNAELDIGYIANGDLDTAAVASHIGGGSGFIVRLYDQKGSANAVQTTATAQPLYVASGQNGRPVGRWGGTNDYLLASGFTIDLASRSIMFICRENSEVTNTGFVVINPAAGSDFNQDTALIFASGNTSNYHSLLGGVSSVYNILQAGSGATPLSLVTEVFGGGNGEMWVNSVSMGTDSHADFTTSGGGLLLGARFLSGAITSPFLDGDIPELIIANVAWSTANREAAEAAANSYWSVF